MKSFRFFSLGAILMAFALVITACQNNGTGDIDNNNMGTSQEITTAYDNYYNDNDSNYNNDNEVMTGIGDGIGEATTGIGDGVGEIVTGIGDGIGEIVTGAGDGLGEIATGIGEGISDAVTDN